MSQPFQVTRPITPHSHRAATSSETSSGRQGNTAAERGRATGSHPRAFPSGGFIPSRKRRRTPFTEAHLRCFSKARAEKERSILKRFQERFESGLKKLHEGLAKPRTRKSLDHVQRRVGRLLKENTRVARHYNVTITPDQKASKAVSVTWTFEPVAGTMMTHPGVYCLRSNVLDWEADTMWKNYITLTDAEAVFRALKSELGLRPIFHQKEHRADGHLFISVLAYQAVQVLRTPMKKAGYHDNWTSLRRILGTLQRTTTTFTRRGGKTLHRAPAYDASVGEWSDPARHAGARRNGCPRSPDHRPPIPVTR